MSTWVFRLDERGTTTAFSKCPECGRHFSGEELAYGHDCEV